MDMVTQELIDMERRLVGYYRDKAAANSLIDTVRRRIAKYEESHRHEIDWEAYARALMEVR